MTTGSAGLNTRTLYAVEGGLSHYFGRVRTRTWTGGDRTLSVNAVVVLRNPLTGKLQKRKVKVFRKEVPHPYSMSLSDKSMNVYRVHDLGSSVGWLYASREGGRLVVETLTDPWTSNHDIDLIAKLTEQINGSDFNPAVFLAEGNQTLDLIADRAKRLAKSMAYLRKGNLREAVRASSGHDRRNVKIPLGVSQSGRQRSLDRSLTRFDSTFGRNVLEVQYGWRPLIQDMYDGAQWLAHSLHAPFLQRMQARRKAVRIAKPSTTAHGLRYKIEQWEVKKQIIAYLSEPPTSGVALALQHPEEVLWEKIPYSFVIDWAIPIGDYLRARSAASALKATYVITRTDRKTREGVKLGLKGPWQIDQFYPVTYGEEFERNVSVNRTVTSTLNVPLPTFKPLEKAASMEHCLNALALLGVANSENPDDVIRRISRT